VLKSEAGGVRMDSKSVKHDGTMQTWLETIDAIIERRLDRNGIIHTVSYDRAEWIMRNSRHRYYMTGNLEEFLDGEAGRCVLVSPVVTTGVDFPYRACEYQIISKVPFPDTRSRIMKARIDAIPNYREAITMQTIQQSAGRGMRAEDDQCETFIVDAHALWFLHKAADFATRDFLDAITFERRIPAPPKRLAA
jgi:ATP-dependent DNA helicase DinG